MSNIVFILGAGASFKAGAPLMGNFLDVARDLLNSGRAGENRQQFERVFKAIGALQVVHSKAQLDLKNIESIFTALELGKIIQRVPGMTPAEIPQAITALKTLIVVTLEQTMMFPVRDQYPRPPAPYDEFAKLLNRLGEHAHPKRSASVITFNYDIAADMALDGQGLGPHYALELGQPGGANEIPLLKLHGSLNWGVDSQSEKIRALTMTQFFRHLDRRYNDPSSPQVRIPIGSQLKQFFACEKIDVRPEPVIVPPTWNKADYHSALSAVWAAAAQHLSEAEYIFVIGYSLPETDSFFRHLYALGSVGDNPLRRITVFNPDSSGDTQRRFERLLGLEARARFDYQATTFEVDVGRISDLFPRVN